MGANNWFSREEQLNLAIAAADLRVDLGRAFKTLVDDGRISALNLLVTYLWLDDWTYREIAEKLGCSLGAAYNAVQRVRDAICESGLMQGSMLRVTEVMTMVDRNSSESAAVGPGRGRAMGEDERFHDFAKANPAVKQAFRDVLAECCPAEFARLLQIEQSRVEA